MATAALYIEEKAKANHTFHFTSLIAPKVKADVGHTPLALKENKIMGNIIINKLQPIGMKSKEHKYDECIQELNSLWNEIPEPKTEYDDGNVYLIIEYFVSILLKMNNYDEAYKWAIKGTIFNLKRNLAGEAEFLIGKVAFAKGDYEFAKDMFYIAKKRSSGRCFKGIDPKSNEYKDLIKDYDLR